LLRPERSIPFSRCWRISSFVISVELHCQGLCRSPNYTSVPEKGRAPCSSTSPVLICRSCFVTWPVDTLQFGGEGLGYFGSASGFGCFASANTTLSQVSDFTLESVFDHLGSFNSRKVTPCALRSQVDVPCERFLNSERCTFIVVLRGKLSINSIYLGTMKCGSVDTK
jgi:hypothetical protein